MAASTTSALAQAHQIALERGDVESAKYFADSAARFAMYYATGNPLLPVIAAPIERKPKRRRKKRQGSSHASKFHHAATMAARRESTILAGFVGVAAILGLLALFLAFHHPSANDLLTSKGVDSHGH